MGIRRIGWRGAGEYDMGSSIVCILHYLYDQIKEDGCVEGVVCLEKMRSVYKILIEKPEGQGSLRRPWRTWYVNMKMDPRNISFGGARWFIWLITRACGGNSRSR